jgi:hypothetical protein
MDGCLLRVTRLRQLGGAVLQAQGRVQDVPENAKIGFGRHGHADCWASLRSARISWQLNIVSEPPWASQALDRVNARLPTRGFTSLKRRPWERGYGFATVPPRERYELARKSMALDTLGRQERVCVYKDRSQPTTGYGRYVAFTTMPLGPEIASPLMSGA